MKLSTKPTLWILAGVAIGGIGMASLMNGLGITPARANSETRLAAIGSLTEKSMAELQAMDEGFAALADYVGPSVVHIRGKSSTSNGRMAPVEGQGSGIIYRSDGYIVTNDHVVASFDEVEVHFADGSTQIGKVIRAGDQTNDIAVVKVNKTGLKAAEFGNSATVKPGQYALAFGAPFGIENSVTVGHISGLGRSSMIADAQLNGRLRNYTGMIQTDAPINPGNSGGALVNIYGQVIGINTSIYGSGGSIYGGSGGNVGIGFAIPSNQVKFVADLLIKDGKLSRGFMGVQLRDMKPFERTERKLPGGAVVVEVEDKSPAAKAGFQAKDVVVGIGELEVNSELDLRNALYKYGPGKTVDVTVARDGKTKTLAITVGAPPKDDQRREAPAPQEELYRGFEAFPDMPNVDPFADRRSRSEDDSKKSAKVDKSGPVQLGIGIVDLTDELRKSLKVPADESGVYVSSVAKGSVADRIGLEAGDLITEFDREKVTSADQLIRKVRAKKWGEDAQIAIKKYTENSNSKRSQTFTIE